MSSWSLAAVHHVGITVSDIERSIVFYRDLLGMQMVGRRPCVDEGYVAEQTGYDGVKLSVASFKVHEDHPNSLEIVQYLNHTGNPVPTSTNQPGVTHLCLVVDDLSEAHENLRSQGVRFRSAPVTITAGPNKGGKVIYLYDPDDYVLELFEPAAQRQ